MRRAFDVGLESLAAVGGAALSARGANPPAARAPDPSHSALPPADLIGKSFFIETFGCQMNDHDSEKVSGVLLGRGYRAVESPAQADLVLYNTCSIREKAAQKVFARLGDWKTTSNGKIIGVL